MTPEANLLCGICSIQYALFYIKVWKLFTTSCGKCGRCFVISFMTESCVRLKFASDVISGRSIVSFWSHKELKFNFSRLENEAFSSFFKTNRVFWRGFPMNTDLLPQARWLFHRITSQIFLELNMVWFLPSVLAQSV